MCGIIAGFQDANTITRGLAALAHRGPDGRGQATQGGLTLASARLAIIDPGPQSDQPFKRDGITLIYNGELWNSPNLRRELIAAGVTLTTHSDTEIIAALLAREGAAALPRFDGMFALAWTADDVTLHAARDRHGQVPLHVADSTAPGIASEVKGLLAAGYPPGVIRMVEPGQHLTLTPSGITSEPFAAIAPADLSHIATPAEAGATLRPLLERAVWDRLAFDGTPAVALSGGIDSACIAALIRLKRRDVVAYHAVYDPGSPDRDAAHRTADALGIPLIEVPIPPPTTEALRDAVRIIEMPYKAQVEIAYPTLHLARTMASDGIRVVFDGSGADELFGSYGFAQAGFDSGKRDWHTYRQTLYRAQHQKNFARANKAYMAHGVEARLPFCSDALVKAVLGLPRHAAAEEHHWKAALLHACTDLLPHTILSRPKLAFQTGLGMREAAQRVLGGDPRATYQRWWRHHYGDAAPLKEDQS